MSALPVQGCFDELGTPLREVTFVVVDLETTGGSAHDCAITEIGAVKVRGGQVLGELQTLVNPGQSIPPFVSVLTGITDAMVAGAPTLGTALSSFLELAGDAVWVAHNAPFDLGFLRAACERTGRAWPAPRSLDTARLARRLLTRDEARDCRLQTLARYFRSPVTPTHRALDDARATVAVLHGLLERVGSTGIQTLEELQALTRLVDPAQAAKRHLATHLPHKPGVYVFRDAQGRPLYVGTSKDLRRRVRQYFVASEPRTRMAEMVRLAASVDAVECPTAVEASVRELRLIAAQAPRYNRRSRRPQSRVWLRLTTDRFPRLSVVRTPGPDDVGPFAGRRAAESAAEAVHAVVALRTCTKPIGPRTSRTACALAGLGRCGAPCEGRESPEAYGLHVEPVAAAFAGGAAPLIAAAAQRVESLAAAHRYEDAAAARDRLSSLVRGLSRTQRVRSLRVLPLLVAAQPREGGWDLLVVRGGRFAASAHAAAGTPPRPVADALVHSSGEVVPAAPGTEVEEAELLLAWLSQPGTRLVEVEGQWCSPVGAAAGHRQWLDVERDASAGFDDRRRGLRPDHRPPARIARARIAGAG